MWTATLKSGVHATLAGVVLAMFIPMRSNKDPNYSPLKSMEHDLHTVVAFFVLPVFAFANAGVIFFQYLTGYMLEHVSGNSMIYINTSLMLLLIALTAILNYHKKFQIK